jgi:hypothetical protein
LGDYSKPIGCKTGDDMSASGTHHPTEFKHAADMEWEMGRFGNVTKFLFHPRPERPTEPNAGFLKYAPGASFPLHRHDFAQIWYIIEGGYPRLAPVSSFIHPCIRFSAAKTGCSPPSWRNAPSHRVTGGGHPPPVPTERGVRISRTNALRK